ncbi:hypothetical protein SNE40_007410 [Patella caerulea]|uniref:Uncharacterized protein n=2 Tax=Patella caerulea TaxID=87958 RepID=A0AAN8PTM6_PATCE
MDDHGKVLFVNKIVILFLTTSFQINSCKRVQFCYQGDIDTARQPYNEDCLTEKRHLSEGISLRNDNRSIMGSKTTEGPKQEDTKQFCLIFQYFINVILGKETHVLMTNTMPKANFSCDHTGICKSDGYFSNKSMNGIEGNLYCCSDSDNCNRLSLMPGVPPNQQLCYQTSGNTGKITNTKLPCTNPEDWCASSTITSGTNVTRSYYCERNRCITNGITHFSQSFSICKNITNGKIREELCCCLHNGCNKPPQQMTTEIEPPEPNTVDNSEQNHSHDPKFILVGIMTGSVLLIAILIGVCLIVISYRRKIKAMRENAVYMSYQQINADEVSNSETAHIL